MSGVPPYKASNGKEVPKSDPLYKGSEQFFRHPTFQEAFLNIYSLTNGGKELSGKYIIDSQGVIIFSDQNPNDVQLLLKAAKAIDREGVEFIEPEI
jgi:hypothetical protein